MLNAIGLLIALSCLAFSHYALGFDSRLADNIAANGFGLVLGTAFRFWSYRRFVWVRPAPEIDAEVVAAAPAGRQVRPHRLTRPAACRELRPDLGLDTDASRWCMLCPRADGALPVRNAESCPAAGVGATVPGRSGGPTRSSGGPVLPRGEAPARGPAARCRASPTPEPDSSPRRRPWRLCMLTCLPTCALTVSVGARRAVAHPPRAA